MLNCNNVKAFMAENHFIKKILSQLKYFWKMLGSGLITGASDDDPSAITTFSQAGAQFGLATLWMALFAFPFLAVLQEMSARIGLVTRKGLTGVVKAHYPKWVLYFVIFITCPAFLLNIGADIAMIGSVGNMLFPSITAMYISIGISVFIFISMLMLHYRKLIVLMKYVCLCLLVYTIVPFISSQHLSNVFKHSIIPSLQFNKEFFIIITAIWGAIISPYVFFWQASVEAEEFENRKYLLTKKKSVFLEMRKDIIYGAFFAVLIMYSIILTSGTVLYNNNIRTINTVKDAAMALFPLAGKLSYLLFAIGIIATGLLIIPVLAGSVSYILSEAFNWKKGFNKKFKDAKHFYAFIFIAILIGLLIQFLKINPVKVLLFTTALYGIIAPFVIALILHICNNKKIMGAHINSLSSNIFGFLALLFLSTSSFALLYFSFF